jgi:hypothetical protein
MMARDATPREEITEEDFRWLGRQMLDAKGADAPYWSTALGQLTEVARAQWPATFATDKLTIEDAIQPNIEPRSAQINLAEIFYRNATRIEATAIVKRLDFWIAHYKQTGCAPMRRFVSAWRMYFILHVAPNQKDFL